MSWWKSYNKDSNRINTLVEKDSFAILRKANKFSYLFFITALISQYFLHIFYGILVIITAFLTILECALVLRDIGKRKGLSLIFNTFLVCSLVIVFVACINAEIFLRGWQSYVHHSTVGAAIILMLYALFISKFSRAYNAIPDISYTIFVFLYITLPVCLAIMLAGDGLAVNDLGFLDLTGIKWMVYIILITKAADFGRIIGGNAFGDKGIIHYFSKYHSIEAYCVGCIFAMASSLSSWYFLRKTHPHLLLFSISFGLMLSIIAFLGAAVAEMLAHDARVGTKVGDVYNPIRDIGVLKHLGSLCITMPVGYAAIHIIDLYVK
ncbi:MAG: phosphatidate cytidylyltransferase [Chlamydiia bacterium]|nr:phosphatidate cytidylyltransferase [Chlamydiia bacterium]